jgi:hypothetical protein
LKRSTTYVLVGVIILAVMALIWSSRNGKTRVLDERVTFRKRDKIPYGTFVAYENLERMFPNAAILTRRQEPGYWDSVSVYERDQAVIIITPQFNADIYELKNLVRFAEYGNDVFISTSDLPFEVSNALNCSVSSSVNLASYYSRLVATDTLTLSLSTPPFSPKLLFTYPGKEYDGHFTKIDSTTSTVLGNDESGRADFIHFKAGKGNLYVHLAPMAFSNYFLMHKRNIAYYEKVFSLLSPDIVKIVWDEYYLTKKPRQNERKNWLSALLGTKNSAGQKSFAAAFWLLLILLLIYVLVEMRRKQRYIPVIKRPSNDSLDFVKTIGRLYYDKGDHRNLCRKMAAYFLDYVRNRYKLPTTLLNDEFIKALHYKSAIEESELAGIVYFIRELDAAQNVSDRQLTSFHKQLEAFYKKA